MKKILGLFSSFMMLIFILLYLIMPVGSARAEISEVGQKKIKKTKCPAPYETYNKETCDGSGGACFYTLHCPANPN